MPNGERVAPASGAVPGDDHIAALRRAWRDRNFILYIGSNAIGWGGTWIQRTAIGWLSWELTHSASWVGIVSLIQYLPLIVLGPLFGVVLDRHDRKHFALGVQWALTLLASVLCAVKGMGWLDLRMLIVLGVLLGCTNGAYQPVRLAIVHDVVRGPMVTQAIAINAVLFAGMRLVGPALGGILIATAGLSLTFMVCAIAYGLSAIALIALKTQPHQPSASSGGLGSQFADGVRYALATPAVRSMMALTLITSVMARGVLELMPAYAGGEFHRGSSGLATLMSSIGGGAIVAGWLLSHGGNRRVRTLMWYACIGSGLAAFTFGLMPNFGGAIAAAVVMGTSTTLASIGLQAILQGELAPEYRGRVIGIWGVGNVAGPSMGSAMLGGIAHLAGLRATTCASGLLCALLCYVVMRRSAAFRR
ncbi:MFS transporter [Solimonas marina]|uniref:MFS transporter n=1 Tax=Solimonas marina TaxID=2714601 RepID=A0A970B678_9GAMM|nr:MFS transporter [Solimonas marina]NKF24157.1 MFS transporter [Solimonas marina]